MKNKLLFLILLFVNLSCSKKPSVPTEPFDTTYTAYTSVLKTYVIGEKVDYKHLQENRQNLDSYINQLAGTTSGELDEMSQNEQMAYWINAYNGITLRSIIDAYPVKSIQNIKGVWKEKKWYVAEQELTLDQIEHQILRPTFQDARVHFAVHSASVGSPPLFNEPFKGDILDNQLNLVVSRFVQNVHRHTINFEKHTIKTTEIFSWFWTDFVEKYNSIKFSNTADIDNAVLNFTSEYLSDSTQSKFDKTAKWYVSFYRYDWSLNDIER